MNYTHNMPLGTPDKRTRSTVPRMGHAGSHAGEPGYNGYLITVVFPPYNTVVKCFHSSIKSQVNIIHECVSVRIRESLVHGQGGCSYSRVGLSGIGGPNGVGLHMDMVDIIIILKF